MHRAALMWFRRDLRLADNPALLDAVGCAEGVACVFVSAAGRDPHAPGASYLAREQLSLASLATSLAEHGCELTVLPGVAVEAIPKAAAECGASAVTCSRDWTPAGLAEERAVASALLAIGVELRVSEGQLLAIPGSVRTKSEAAFRVFTPFHREWLRSVHLSAPASAPRHIRTVASAPQGIPVAVGEHVSSESAVASEPGERGAQRRLAQFVDDAIVEYAGTHDLPAVRGTSELSAPLACGELSPRQVMWTAQEAVGEDIAAPFVRQLAWREFAYHVLASDPESLDRPLRREFSAMPWRDDSQSLDAWTVGQTGWPLVDAGMRQLARTGWMHNRVRMVVASALTKDLLVPWQRGSTAFERLLGDYDPAANAFNWQWVAGSGADAAPYFRIFNPALQGARFDSEGEYVRRWVPELAGLPARYIHRPWAAPSDALLTSGVRLGGNYPHQLIDHAEARLRALAAFSAVKLNR